MRLRLGHGAAACCLIVAALLLIQRNASPHAVRVRPRGDLQAAARDTGPPRKVLIDLGANCGNSYLRLRRKGVVGADWEVFLWEANPQLIKWYLNDLEARTPGVTVVPLAAWVEEKPMSFFLTRGQENITDIKQFKAHRCDPKSIHQPAGASSLFSGMGAGGEAADKRRKGAHRPGLEIQVQAVDFNAWYADLNLREQDTVILKIDIEGAEIPLLKHFLQGAAGALPCTVDTFYIEWHSWMIASGADRAETKSFEDGFLDKVAATCGRKPGFTGWH